MSDPNFNEPYNQEFQPPPPPFSAEEYAEEPAPEISEVQSLTSIFYEPATVFESFRKKPRFFSALIIILVLITLWVGAYFSKVGFENFIRADIENSSGASQMSKDDIDKRVEQASHPVVKYFAIGGQTIAVIIFFFVFVLLYFLGVMLMGGKMSFLQSMGVTAYSWFPTVLISTLLNFILLFVKPTDSYDTALGIRGLVQANLGFLVNAKTQPILSALLSSFDVFQFYGMFLVAVGMRITGRISSGSAWSIAIGVWLLGVAIRIFFAAVFG